MTGVLSIEKRNPEMETSEEQQQQYDPILERGDDVGA